MSKLLNTMFMVTQSVRPSTGMFASGGLIYYTSSLGRYNLTNQAGDFVITEFVGSGTWTRQSDAKLIQVLLVGGGGGGGGGTKAGVGRATGGQGGCGGAMLISYIASASLTGSTFTVNVGEGGNGGLGSDSITGTGLAGASGGPTSLVSGSTTVLLAPGGPAGISLVSGAQPPNVNGANTSNTQMLSTYKTIFLYGLNGAGSSNTLVRVPTSNRLLTTPTDFNPDGVLFHALNGVRGAGAGGSGGDLIPGPPRQARAGSSGSGIWTGATAFESGTPGLGGTGVFGSNGTSNAYSTAYIFGISGSSTGFTYGLGTAGHGGGSGNITNPATLNGGNGGNGGYYGAGGGGGGGCSTGSIATAPSGGRGGNGGGGYACFVEYF